MASPVPHPIPYQGSKRRLARAILSYIPKHGFQRLIEPFAGSAAVTLAAAEQELFTEYLLGDALIPLAQIWSEIKRDPSSLADQYQLLWGRERTQSINAYYQIRDEFNVGRDPAKLLFLLARCVKNAVRFNPSGDFNQSPDKRRSGTLPATMRKNLMRAHQLLDGRCEVVGGDFFDLIERSRPGDFVYLDPPYQGTSEGRDRRYISGVSRKRVMECLDLLNARDVPFILSYDGSCGGTSYGEALPNEMASQILLDVGRSSQATLNGEQHATVESLYLSPLLAQHDQALTRELRDFEPQTLLRREVTSEVWASRSFFP
ncbi:MAG TPA: DNA adenine methylase [Acidobacteriaceae bacterium]